MEDLRRKLEQALDAYHEACMDSINSEWDANQAVHKAAVAAIQTNGNLDEFDSSISEYKRILLENTKRELILKADAEGLLSLLPENERHAYSVVLMPPEM